MKHSFFISIRFHSLKKVTERAIYICVFFFLSKRYMFVDNNVLQKLIIKLLCKLLNFVYIDNWIIFL